MKLGAIHRAPSPSRLRAGAAMLSTCMPRAAVDYFGDLVLDGSTPLGNDRVGCCVPAAAVRLAQARWKRIAGEDYGPTEEQVITLYEAWAGYDPANPATDVGTDVVAGMDAWLSSGIWIKPRLLLDIGPWVAVDIGNILKVRAAVDYAVGALFTLNLVDGDTDGRDTWDCVREPAPRIGGHEVCCLGYDPDGFQVVTWGRVVTITTQGLLQRLQAVSVPISRLITDTHGLTADGQTWDQLIATISSLGNGQA